MPENKILRVLFIVLALLAAAFGIGAVVTKLAK